MYHMVLPWDGADGAPNHEGYHWDIINRGETLQRKLPPELHQDSFGSVGDSLYGEEGIKNINFYVPVNHEDVEALHPGRGVHSGGKEPQVGV